MVSKYPKTITELGKIMYNMTINDMEQLLISIHAKQKRIPIFTNITKPEESPWLALSYCLNNYIYEISTERMERRTLKYHNPKRSKNRMNIFVEVASLLANIPGLITYIGLPNHNGETILSRAITFKHFSLIKWILNQNQVWFDNDVSISYNRDLIDLPLNLSNWILKIEKKRIELIIQVLYQNLPKVLVIMVLLYIRKYK